MKVLNIIWGFSLGTGIDKCFLTYASLGETDSSVEVSSVCINLNNRAKLNELHRIGAEIIDAKSRFDFSWIKELTLYIKKYQPDVIFTHGFNGAIMMLFITCFKRINTPFICSEHGLYFAGTPLKKPLEFVYNHLMGFTYKKFAKKLICVDNSSKKYWIEKGVNPNKIITVHNGISKEFNAERLDLTHLGIEKGTKVLITVSSLYAVKGLNYLFDAIPLLKQKTSVPFKYIVIGTGEDLEFLKKKSHDLKIEDIVHFAGYQEKVPIWLNSADIFLLPSLSECHSISLLEAMRAGKAIVATNVGGNPESVRNNMDGLLVPSQNPEALADAIKKLLEDEELSLSFGKSAAKRFNELFTVESMKKNLIKALKITND